MVLRIVPGTEEALYTGQLPSPGSQGCLHFSGFSHLPYCIGMIHFSTSSTQGQVLELKPLFDPGAKSQTASRSLVHVAQE